MLTARGRWGGLLGAFVAVAAGVTVVCLGTLLYAAGRPQVPDRLAAAAVVVQSPLVTTPADPFAESRPWSSRAAGDLAGRLAALPGVVAAVPDRTFYAQAVVAGRPDPAVVRGHGWSSSRLGGPRLVAGGPPRRAGEVALDRALGRPPGSAVTLLTVAGPAPYTVTGVLDGPGLYLADEVAAGRAPGVRAIGLVLRPGADVSRVATAAAAVTGARGQVLAGADRSALEPRSDARTRWIGMQVLTGVAVLAGFSSIFIVAATFAFAVNQRRRELGLLRTIGATPRQVRRMLAREAVAVGGSAALVGVVLGTALAYPVGGLLIDVGLEPATYRVGLTAWPIAASFAVGPVVALLGVWVAARRASRVPPLAALRAAVVEPRVLTWRRWLTGGVCAAGGLALAVGTATAADASTGASYALYSAMALVVAAAVLAPAVVPPLAWLLTAPFTRGAGATGMLVREGVRAAARRVAGAAAPVLLTVSFAVLTAGLVQTSTSAYAAGRSAAIDAAAVVAPDGTPGLTDAVVAATRGAALLPTTVHAPDGEPLAALGVDPAAFAAARNRLDVRAGTLADLRGAGTAVLTEAVAGRLGRSVGGTLAVTFADGESADLRVVAVVADRAVPAGLLLPRAVVRARDPSALTAAILTAAAPTADGPDALPAEAGARIIDVATYAAEVDATEDRLVWVFTLLLIGVSAGYGMLAVANILLIAGVQRRGDFRVLRLAGATGRQVAWVAAAEAAIVVAVGAVLGGAVAFVALVSVRTGLSEQVGAPVDLVIPWPTIGGVVAACLVLAVAASVLPTRGRASRSGSGRP